MFLIEHASSDPLVFSTTMVPKLRQAGWHIAFDADYPYQIILEKAVVIVASSQDALKIQAFGGFFCESSSHHYGEQKNPRKACRFNAD